MKKLFTYLLIVIALFIIGCGESLRMVSKDTSIAINDTYADEKASAMLIAPYKLEHDQQMNEVIVFSNDEFPRLKGKPETKLGNLVADLSYKVAGEMYDGEIDFCLLNFGGLRTNLPKGEITRGKVFELMPFENELVVITIHQDSLASLFEYLMSYGGQPISQLRIKQLKQQAVGNYQVKDYKVENELALIKKETISVLTTDYLANGGDNMTFFANPIQSERIGLKLRDAIIRHFKSLNEQGKQLEAKLDGRISFE